MSVPTLVAPTVTLGSLAGVVLPATETYSFLSTDTGFTYLNTIPASNIVVRYVCGTGGSGTLTVLFQQSFEGVTPASLSISITAGSTYLLGPFSPTRHNDGSNLVHINRSTSVTTDSVGLYLAAGSVT